jgi:hypothetical protein
MPETTRVDVDGLEDAERDFRRWADQLGPAVTEQARAFAGRVAGRVHPPVLTGALASSVDVETLVGEEGIGISIGDGLPYAGWIEFGGSRGRPSVPEGRYLYPAAMAAEDEWHELGEHVAEQTIERFSWSKAV